MADIKDFADFQARLDESIKGMDGLLRRYPKDPMLVSIRRQLDSVKERTRGGRRPTRLVSQDARRGGSPAASAPWTSVTSETMSKTGSPVSRWMSAA